MDKILSDKEKEINCLKNHSQILLTEVKKLNCNNISILKVDKETSMYVRESSNTLEFEMEDKLTQHKGSKLKIKVSLPMNFYDSKRI
jgi:hypothetical protein